jgi:hypothetical protein
VAARLAGAIRDSLRETDVKALFDNTGTILWDHVDAAGLARALEEEIPRMRHLIGRTIPKPG